MFKVTPLLEDLSTKYGVGSRLRFYLFLLGKGGEIINS